MTNFEDSEHNLVDSSSDISPEVLEELSAVFGNTPVAGAQTVADDEPTPSPAVPDAPSPAVSDAPSPAVPDAPSPAVSDAPSPAVSDAPSPAVPDAPDPSQPNLQITPHSALAQLAPQATLSILMTQHSVLVARTGTTLKPQKYELLLVAFSYGCYAALTQGVNGVADRLLGWHLR